MCTHTCTAHMQVGELRDLLERSPSIVNVAFTEGRTALYWAVCNGREDVIRLLLKHQANPSLGDKDGDTCAAPAPSAPLPHPAAPLRRAAPPRRPAAPPCRAWPPRPRTRAPREHYWAAPAAPPMRHAATAGRR